MLDHFTLSGEGQGEYEIEGRGNEEGRYNVWASKSKRSKKLDERQLLDEIETKGSLLLIILSMQRMYTVTLPHGVEEAAKSKNSKNHVHASNHQTAFPRQYAHDSSSGRHLLIK